jgi:hypothetical protein
MREVERHQHSFWMGDKAACTFIPSQSTMPLMQQFTSISTGLSEQSYQLFVGTKLSSGT